MGAQLWHHAGPWRTDPAESLTEIQVQVVREQYDIPSLLQEHLKSARDAVQYTLQDDPCGLLEFYRSEVVRLEALAALPASAGFQEDIRRLRALYCTSGEGIGSVLDVTHVSDSGDTNVTKRLPLDEILRLCGTDRPTLAQATEAVDKVNEEIGRGDSVCFPYYSADSSQPLGWYFVGNTID